MLPIWNLTKPVLKRTAKSLENTVIFLKSHQLENKILKYVHYH